MRVIPVIDLLGNQAVHAIKGERSHYKPVRSRLCRTSDPVEIADAFRRQLGLSEFYIADLDAILNPGSAGHRNLISNLALQGKYELILDAGISDAGTARGWLELGVRKAVIGSETLTRRQALKEIPAEVDPDRLVFSLDCRSEEIVSKCPELAALSPLKALELLQASGWREVILLDLARVGSGRGIHQRLVTDARRNFPGLALIAGGGITGPEELDELNSLGIEGVLLATALHRGAIGPEHLPAPNRKR
jgi:phosphoribosylformimino-5-aminoimidazole carboxamide ribotide isomerase